ncbi:MAG: hypothetical protein ABIQ15_09770, partial [Nocardioides sp.]
MGEAGDHGLDQAVTRVGNPASVDERERGDEEEQQERREHAHAEEVARVHSEGSRQADRHE